MTTKNGPPIPDDGEWTVPDLLEEGRFGEALDIMGRELSDFTLCMDPGDDPEVLEHVDVPEDFDGWLNMGDPMISRAYAVLLAANFRVTRLWLKDLHSKVEDLRWALDKHTGATSND